MKNWYEVWADNGFEIPYILCVKFSELNNMIKIIDIKENKTLIEECSYDVIKNWLLEDEYEKISERIYQEQDTNKNWAISIILKTNSISESLFKENIFLVKAEKEIEALEIAKKYLLNLEIRQKNKNQETIKWNFHSVIDIQEINDDIMTDCACIYSRNFTGKECTVLDSRIDNV